MRSNFDNAKRVWFLTDTHLGVRSNNVEWIDIMEDYFDNFFIPLVEREYRPGDVLMHGGDVFDSRNSLNLRVLNLGLRVFSRLASIFKDGIIIIPGNHDLYLKSSNDINSVKPLSFIPGIYVYEEPMSIKLGSTNWLLMPWRKNHEEEGNCVLGLGHGNDYLLCHADMVGMKFNRHTDVSHGCDITTYKSFKRVYNGHIHFSQKKNNVNTLGSPYQLTRSDAGNPKGVTVLDLSTDKETYFVNDHSPKFISFKFVNLLDMTPAEVRSHMANNFVDIHVDSKDMFKVPVSVFLSYVETNYRTVNFRPLNAQPSNTGEDVGSMNLEAELSIPSLIKLYVDSTELNAEDRTRLDGTLSYLHRQAEERKNADKIMI